MNWFKRLFIYEAQPSCETCEVLKMELAHAHQTNRLMLERLIAPKPDALLKTENTPDESESPLKPIKMGRSHIPYQVRQQMIRQSDEQTLRILQDSQKNLREARIEAQNQTEKVSDEPVVAPGSVEELERNILAGVK